MRCPKCGYTSFESYDSCRKCSADLMAFKQTHGIIPMVLPPSLRAEMAASLGIETARQNTASPDTSNDMFSFDLPTEQQQTPTAPTAAPSPFSFDDSPAPSFDTPAAAADPFASLMSSTPQPATAAPQAPTQGLELNSFSWDDTPAPGEAGNAASGDAKKASDDDFSSLFGDPVDSNKK